MDGNMPSGQCDIMTFVVRARGGVQPLRFRSEAVSSRAAEQSASPTAVSRSLDAVEKQHKAQLSWVRQKASAHCCPPLPGASGTLDWENVY